MKIEIKKVRSTAIIPTRGSEKAAGYDLYFCPEQEGDTIIDASETKMLKTGVAVAIPDGYVGLIYARSGLACKQGLRPANCVGVIDSDYRGELIVALHNDNQQSDKRIEAGERIAQLVIAPYLSVEFNEVEELDATERGDGGFGSTGK